MINCSFDPKKPLCYVRYARMSDPRQNPRSPDQQFSVIDETLRRCGYQHWTHVEDFRDNGISGRFQRKRTGFQDMLLKIRTGELQVDAILADAMDRVGRMDDLAALQQDLLHRHGVVVLTADAQFADPTGQGGRAIQFVQNLQAMEEGRVKAGRVLRGKRDCAKLGKWPGGPAPMGYLLKAVVTDGGSGSSSAMHSVLSPNPNSAWLIREIYDLAHKKGWGGMRIANHLNDRPELVQRFRRFNASTICRILSSPIYKGELVFGQVATDVVNDHRIMRRNPESEYVRTPGFCDAIIDAETWDAVAAQRRPRSEAAKRRTKRRQKLPGKQVQPLDPGLVLKYALTGLVRCGSCGSSMRVNSSGTLGPDGRRYTYRVCPTSIDGACTNRLHVPEPWLWKAVCAKLRANVLPPESGAAKGDAEVPQVPTWALKLMQAVRAEWESLSCKEHPQRQPLVEENQDLESRISGWLTTLSKTDLAESVRSLVENRLAEATDRAAQIDTELTALCQQETRLAAALDANAVVKALHRLDEALECGNPSATNVELALHIDRIEVFPDRRIIMRTCRLGVFEGAVQLLSRPSHAAASALPLSSSDAGQVRIKPRRLGCRRVVEQRHADHDSSSAPVDVQDIQRFAGLGSKWFWEDVVEFPERRSWSAEHAEEVFRLVEHEGWTQARIARHFNKSSPTVRKALQIALKQRRAESAEGS